MKKLLRLALTAITLFVCSGAWATEDLNIKVVDTYASLWSSYSGKTYNITFTDRIFKKNAWDGICLPFDMNESQLNNTFGEGNYKIRSLKEMSGTNFVFEEATTITAGKPYLVYLKDGITDDGLVTFKEVTVASNITDEYIKQTLTDGLEFRGFYFRKYGAALVDNQSGHAQYTIKSDGTLQKDYWYNDPGCIGPFAYFFVNDASAVTSIGIEGVKGSSGGGESGGGEEEQDLTTLEGKIAARVQLTDAPTIYIDLPDRNGEKLDDYLYKIRGNGQKEDVAPYRRAKIKVIATTDKTSPHYIESFEEDADHLEMKVRGNSTSSPGIPYWEYQTDRGGMKKPYRLKFAKKDKTTGQNFKHDLLGHGYKKRNWTLLANAFDHSLIRNAVTYELGTIIGMPFNPGYKLVDLVIDGDYRGTYQVSDHCEVDADRINVNEDTGWYLEFQGRQDMLDLPMCFTQPAMVNVKNPEPEDDTVEEQRNAVMDPIKEWLKEWQAGFGSGYTDPTTGWRAYNDEETLAKWWILTELTGDYDGMMTVKVYREADGKLCWGPMWDKDLAYGNYSGMKDPKGTLVAFMSGNGSSVQDYFRDQLSKDPAFMKKVKEMMDKLVNDDIYNTIAAKIDAMATNAAKTEALNYEKWKRIKCGSGQEEYHSGVSGYEEYAAYPAQIKAWLSDRINFVKSEFDRLYNAANVTTAYEYNVTTEAGNSGISSYIDKLTDATMKNRTFTANEWNAISLPFSVEETTLKGIFGNNYELKEFTGVSADGTKMIFKTPADNSISAGMPYLIKPSQAVNAEPLFSGVTVTAKIGHYDGKLLNGTEVTYGNYTFSAHVFKNNLAVDGTVKLISGTDPTLSIPSKINSYDTSASTNGSIAFIRIANGANDPIIQFGDDEVAQRGAKYGIGSIYIDTQDKAVINPSSGDYVNAEIEVYKADGSENGTLDFEDKAKEVSGAMTYYLEVRGRGTTEWNSYDKHSYRLKFAKDEKDADKNVIATHKQDLTGIGHPKRNWVLLANSSDESQLRNALTKTLGDQLGMGFTPSFKYYNLYINDVYQGLYMATDFVQADMEKGDASTSVRIPVDEDTGWVLNMTKDDSTFDMGDLTITGSETTPYINIKNPETSKKVSAEDITKPVSEFISNLWADPKAYVDQTSFINWYIASEIIGGTRTLSDFYAYKEADGETLFFGPLWGNEDGYANSAVTMTDKTTEGSYEGMLFTMAEESAWKQKLATLKDEAWFADAVYARWTTIKDNTLTELNSSLTSIKGGISEAWTANYALDKEKGWKATTTLDAEAKKIEIYLTTRFDYLEKKFKEMCETETYTFDAKDGETDYSGLENKKGNLIIKNRTFSSDYYNSLSLPCDLSTKQIEDVFGTGTDVVTFYEMNGTQLKFKSQDEIKAGKPYFIKPATSVTDPLLKGVTIEQVAGGESVTIKGFGSFEANLRPVVLKTDGSQVYLSTSAKLSKPSNSTKNFSGTRAFFNISKEGQAKQFTFVLGGTPTDIDSIDSGNFASGPIYNLNGQRVGQALQRGIYIKNGKKFIVK